MARWQVAHIITHLELGGAQLATLTALEHSRFFSGTRTLLAGASGQLATRAEKIEGVRRVVVPDLVRDVSPVRDARALVTITRELRLLAECGEPLLVHTHSPKAGVLGRIAARRAGAALVVHSVHGFGHGHGGTSDILGWVERSVARFADGYTTDSDSNRRQGIAEGMFSDRPVRVVHCGIDLEFFQHDSVARASVRRELGIDDETPLVVTLANFKPQKDPFTFVRVAAEVLSREPSVHFVYAGDGPLRSAVEELVARERISDRVHLLGWRDDPARLLSASDVFLLTSRWEGLPQSFAQAMASGLPIVATRVDGAPEAIEHGSSGFLADVGDVDALSDFVETLVRDARLRDAFGTRAKSLAPRFSREVMIDSLDHFYRELTGER
ncbi:MAG: glycosyltransferase [Myxococcota bacterium]